MQNTLWKVIPIKSKGAAYSYGQVTFIQSADSAMDNTYVLPFDTVGNVTLPTSYTEVDSQPVIYGTIRQGGYTYYFDETTYTITRYNEATTDTVNLFGVSGDAYIAGNMNFSILEDGRIVVAIDNYAGDGTFEWHIGNFDTLETSMLFSTPMYEYSASYDSSFEYNWHFVVCNNRVVPMKWSAVTKGADSFWLWDFWVIDVDTAAELYHYNSGEIDDPGTLMQYPICPPVIVGNNVFFPYHTSENPDYPDGSTAPFIFKVNTSSLSTTLIRPRIYGSNSGGMLNGACYDPNTDRIIYIIRYVKGTFGDPIYRDVMSLNPNTNAYTSLVSVLDSGSSIPSVTIKSNTEAYVLYADGNIYALDNFVSPIVDTIPPLNDTTYDEDEPQMDHICPVIDGSGYIWFISGGVVYGRKVSDNSLVSSDISFPMPSGTNPKRIFIYMSKDGKLSVINRNETSGTDKVYILN